MARTDHHTIGDERRLARKGRSRVRTATVRHERRTTALTLRLTAMTGRIDAHA